MGVGVGWIARRLRQKLWEGERREEGRTNEGKGKVSGRCTEGSGDVGVLMNPERN